MSRSGLRQEVDQRQHFRRGGSRVYYASETGCWPAHSLPRDFWTRPRGQQEPVILEEGEEAFSSGEEAAEGEVPLGGFFRGSLRASPSHRSQDSGYSDSGESTNAHNDSDGSGTTPLNVKHITRVYFGENPHLYNDKIVCFSEVNVSTTIRPTSISENSSVAKPLPDIIVPCRTPSRTLHRQDRSNSLEELAEELEHKSVLDVVGRRPNTNRKRITNNVSTLTGRRPPRRCVSAEKLILDPQDQSRRPATVRTRRRWSIGDLQQSQNTRFRRQLQGSSVVSGHASCSINVREEDLATRTTISGSLDDLRDPLQTPRFPNDRIMHVTCNATPLNKLRIDPVALAKEMRNESLQQWLKELGVLYEAECMNTLQSKCLPGDVAPCSNASTTTTRHTVRTIQRRAHAVSTEFAKLCQHLEWLEMSRIPSSAEALVGLIKNFLRDYTNQWTTAPPDVQPQCSVRRQSKVIEQICGRLKEVCGRGLAEEEMHEDQDTTRQVVQVVTALGHAFTKLVDLMLTREIRELVRNLEEPYGNTEARTALLNLTSIGVDGGHICRLIARLGGVRALLGLCLEPRLRCLRVEALRALATVCCIVDGIIELEKAGGVEVVVEVLCDLESPEEERSEAAGVLAQVTSPWVDNNYRLVSLHAHMDAIVNALTDLADSTNTPEIFLLASAALANLTFLDGGCVGAMRAAATARVLLRAARSSLAHSIFTKDQIATVLANLAVSPEAGEEVVRWGGVSVLLELLKTTPARSQRLPELATIERVQQKSAIAISRLCGNPSVARKVAELGGAERLVQLCRDEEERNHSDAVLVACLAALRKISTSLGPQVLRDLDAAELVEPRLLDSFLIYSSRQESFV